MLEHHRKAEFVHIPKTAGTFVRSAFESNIGPDHLYIYTPQMDRLVPSSSNLLPQTSGLIELVRQGIRHPLFGPLLLAVYPLVDTINKNRIKRRYPKLEVPDEATVIFGHFKADKFDGLLAQEPIRGIIIRDPLERMASHYDHWTRNHGKADWGVDVPYAPNITFEQFALLPQLQNFQTQALAGRDIHSFDVVGVTEHTEEFIYTFLTRLQQEGLTSPDQIAIPRRRLNTTPKEQKTRLEQLDEGFIDVFSAYPNNPAARKAIKPQAK